MGIGIWYEMFISDPVAYLFKNADPRGSLRANVSSATVRCLSNMPLGDMLENRHAMSQTVRSEVSPKSQRVGLQARQRLHPQGALPRRGDDPADRGEGRQPAAAGHQRDQAGRREPGEHHHQHRRAAGRRGVCQGRRACARRSSAKRLQQIGQDPRDPRRDVRDPRDAKDRRGRSAHHLHPAEKRTALAAPRRGTPRRTEPAAAEEG